VLVFDGASVLFSSGVNGGSELMAVSAKPHNTAVPKAGSGVKNASVWVSRLTVCSNGISVIVVRDLDCKFSVSKKAQRFSEVADI